MAAKKTAGQAGNKKTARQNGLPTDGAADFTDADGDSMANYGEWRADTSLTNALSVLQMVAATNLPGVAGRQTYTDTTATNGGPYCYRSGVH